MSENFHTSTQYTSVALISHTCRLRSGIVHCTGSSHPSLCLHAKLETWTGKTHVLHMHDNNLYMYT